MKSFPRLGFGTHKSEDRGECVKTAKTTLDVGYYHVDATQIYHSEEFADEGPAGSGVDLDDIFVTTRLDADSPGYDNVPETVRESAEKLGVETIDLLYVHWPLDSYDEDETLAALNKLYENELTADIDPNNLRPDQLGAVIESPDTPVFAHQIEMHPLLQQDEPRAFVEEHDHRLVAYSFIVRSQVTNEEVITDIAGRHDTPPTQVTLMWLIERDVAPIPKAASPEYIRDNFAALDLDLDDEGMATIDDLDSTHHIVDFEEAPWDHA